MLAFTSCRLPQPRIARNSFMWAGGVALIAGLAACGSTTTSPPTGQSTANGSSLPAISIPPASSSAAPAGPTITFSSAAGYKYILQAARATTSPTVTVNGQVQTAPAGQTYLTVDVTVQNPLTDRAAPLDPLVSDTSSALRLAVPITSMATFGLTDGDTTYTCLGDRDPAGVCVLLSGTTVASVTPTDSSTGSAQIQPGTAGTKVIHLVSSFAVPEGAPLSQVTLYVEASATGPLTQIPLG